MGKLRVFLLLFFISGAPLFAANGAKVHGVLFYSPLCSHCHDVVENELPSILKKYDKQFELLLINVSSEEGAELYHSMTKWLNVSKERRGVPSIVIDHQLLFGSKEIKTQLSPLIEKWLGQGGVTLPSIPGIEKLDSSLVVKDKRSLKQMTHASLKERLANDPMGNGVAIGLLALMIFSLIFVCLRWKKRGWALKRIRHSFLTWGYPLLALFGAAIAGYLTYIEFSGTDAACGPIGDCNAVQQSPYTKLFGFLPAGLLGLVGYLLIFILWLWLRHSRRLAWLLPGSILLGVLLSIYFTLLEPFVIGAVCLWCLTSAFLMTLLLWLTCPSQHNKIT